MFMRMLKADAAQRRIYARLDETPDTAKMIFDYASSKPHFEAWSTRLQKATGGKSFGNVRAMHQLDAVGIVEQMDFDDNAKTIDFCVKVIDDDAWQKCEEGVFTGISPGGDFGRKWRDGEFTRYAGKPSEISLVDLPCNPNATFLMMKAEGGEEERPLKGGDELAPTTAELDALATDLGAIDTPAHYRQFVLAQPTRMIKAMFSVAFMHGVETINGLAKRDFSFDERKKLALTGKAMPGGEFPIENKKDLEDAIEAVGQAKDKAEAKKHIIQRATEMKLTDELPADWEGSTKGKPMEKVETIGGMKKGLGDVARLAGALESLTWLATCVTAEASAERDGSPIPARITAWLADGADILAALGTEETKEAMTQLQAAVEAIPTMVMAKAEQIRAMAKAGATISKANMTHVQAIHDHASELGADCAGQAGGGMTKVQGIGTMAKMAGDLATTRGELTMVKAELADLKRQPAPGGPVLRVVDRATDLTNHDATATAQAEAARTAIDKMPDGRAKTDALVRFAIENPEPPRAPASR